MDNPIPLVDLGAQQREIDAELREDLAELFAKTAFVGGPHVAAFEREYADYVGVGHCVGVANGTDAVELALRAVGVGGGDEVIVPVNTFIATAEAVCRAGATPVFVDVDDAALLIDPEEVGAALTRRTKAVVPVHLYGQIAPAEAVAAAASDAAIIEDAAQSQGATRHGSASGALGDLAATSFYPGKNLGAAGDAGAVTTNDADAAHLVRLMRDHENERKYTHEVLGFNSRLDAIQALVLRLKLARLDGWNENRRAAAARYDTMLADVDDVRLPTVLEGNIPVWHLYVVRIPAALRDQTLTAMNAAGVGAALHYPVPLHLTPALAGHHKGGTFPVAERAASELLSLPIYPHITATQQERIVTTLVDCLRA